MYLRTILCLWIMTEYIHIVFRVWILHTFPPNINLSNFQLPTLRRWNRPKPMLQLVGKLLWKAPKWFSNSESERCWRVCSFVPRICLDFFLQTSCRCWKNLRDRLELLQVASWSLTKVAISREILTNIITKKNLLDFFGSVFWTWVNGFVLVEIS